MTPKGFWSYAHDDDANTGNQISRLRVKVQKEISLVLGENVPIFQDIHDLCVGDNLEAKLSAELTSASFLLPILTPRYFNRDWCRRETLTFMRLASEAGRSPLIFPIYFVTDERFDAGSDDDLRISLKKVLYSDWRSLRGKENSTKVSEKIQILAQKIKKDLQSETSPSQPTARALAPEAETQLISTPPTLPTVPTEIRTIPSPPAVTRTNYAVRSEAFVPTLVVHPSPGFGDFTSIQSAIHAADDGVRIEIHPGTYDEDLTIGKNVTLIGLEGAKETRVEEGSRGPLKISAARATLVGLGFHFTTVAEFRGAAVLVTAGQATFQDCAFTSDSDVSVRITGQATNPTFRGCSFRDSLQSGVSVASGAVGMFEDCDFSRNRVDGIQVTEGANPTLRRCTITSNGGGVQVSGHGRGTFDSCAIRDNQRAGVSIFDSGSPILQDSVITRNGSEAIRLEDSTAGGRFIDNDLRGNTRGAWDIAKGAEKNLVREGNKE